MVFVVGRVKVEQFNEDTWRLLAPLMYQGKYQNFHIPVGFRVNLMPVPRPISWLIPPYGRHLRAIILHSYLCRRPSVSRADADGIYRRALREEGVAFLHRWLLWAGMRTQSGLAGATAGQIVTWLLVMALAALVLAVPAASILIALSLLWAAEWAAYKPLLWLRRNPRQRVNRPRFTLRM